MKTAIELIAAERKRQIEEEGYTTDHDDQHVNGELAKAAAAYATSPSKGPSEEMKRIYGNDVSNRPNIWPWDAKWWKPTPDDRIQELVKAGALIAAEIERIKRLK